MAAPDLPNHIDLAALLRFERRQTFWFFARFMFIAPAVLFGLGRLVMAIGGTFPLWITATIFLSIAFGVFGWYVVVRPFEPYEPSRDERFGWPEVGSRSEVMRAVEAEWNNTPSSQKERFGDYYLTPSWLIYFRHGTFKPRPLRSLSWAYFSTNIKNSRRIPRDAILRVVICKNPSRNPLEIDVDSVEQANAFLLALQRRAPWAFYGFTQERQLEWMVNWSRFAKTVKARYAAVQEGQTINQPVGDFPPELTGSISVLYPR